MKICKLLQMARHSSILHFFAFRRYDSVGSTASGLHAIRRRSLGPNLARSAAGPLRRLRAIEDQRVEGGVLATLFREDGGTIRARVQVCT